MAKSQSSEITIVDVNEKIRELDAVQLRTLVLLMVSGHSFMDAYQVVSMPVRQELEES